MARQKRVLTITQIPAIRVPPHRASLCQAAAIYNVYIYIWVGYPPGRQQPIIFIAHIVHRQFCQLCTAVITSWAGLSWQSRLPSYIESGSPSYTCSLIPTRYALLRLCTWVCAWVLVCMSVCMQRCESVLLWGATLSDGAGHFHPSSHPQHCMAINLILPVQCTVCPMPWTTIPRRKSTFGVFFEVVRFKRKLSNLKFIFCQFQRICKINHRYQLYN